MRRSSPINRRLCIQATLRAVIVMAMIGTKVTVQAHAQGSVSSIPAASFPFSAYIAEASQRFGIPQSWIRAIMHTESAGNAQATSPKGAMGLMQLMPPTWAILRDRLRLGVDPYDPHDNILAGAAYLRELHDRYGTPGFLAAYNAGPGRYEDHLATGRMLPDETQSYVASITSRLDGASIDDTAMIAYSTAKQPPIPLEASHPFHFKPAT